ncbi:DUF4421 family protein [Zhouia sp. PK063]|uniref:DUF4421 family protein n=1 Tax=Zhouia sp. PK063 TaxID=3373602 RepID=UPI0037A01353
MKCIIFLILSLIFLTPTAAQTLDSTTVKKYPDKLALTVNLSTDAEEFYIAEDETLVHLQTNNSLKLSAQVNYDFVSFSFGITPTFLPGNDDDNFKGKSKLTDYQLHLFPGRFIQGLHYRNVKGFYVENTQDFLTDWIKDHDPYLQFPNLKAVTFGGSTGYVLHPEFSTKSVFNQQEWQTINVGSLVPYLSYDFVKFTNVFNADYTKENQVNIIVGLGYYYNVVILSNWILSPYIRSGVGPRFIKYTATHEVEKDMYWVTKYMGGLQLSYNRKRFFAGVQGNFKGMFYDTDQDHVMNNNWLAMWYVGYRFDAPKLLKKIVKHFK